MLEHTFCHLPGVGTKTEQRLWRKGIHTWASLEVAAEPPAPALARSMARDRLAASRQCLLDGDANAFGRWLPAAEQWRLFGDFHDQVAYFDIESTGLDVSNDQITCVALYDGRTVRTYVSGENLDAFAADIAEYKVIVTYNGKCFDVPFVERQLGARLPLAHIDLRYLLRALGYSGGLKSCEQAFGLARDDLEGVDGAFAVMLWQDYQASGDRACLETLLAYNVADVISLEQLLVRAFNLKLQSTPFAQTLSVTTPPAPANPYQVDRAVLERVRARF